MRIAKVCGGAASMALVTLVQCSFWDLEALDQTQARVDLVDDAAVAVQDGSPPDDAARVGAYDGGSASPPDATLGFGPDASVGVAVAPPGNDDGGGDRSSRDGTSPEVAEAAVADARPGVADASEAGKGDDAAADSAASAGGACDPAKPFGPPVILAGLVSSSREGGLHLFADELAGLFWEGPLGATSLYATKRADKASSFATSSLLNNVNSAVAQYDPSASGDGLKLVFRATTPGAAGSDDLFWASRGSTDVDFAHVVGLANLNTAYSEVQPFLMPDAAELYFSANPTGDYDIYHTTATGPGAFGAPNAVKEVSSAGFADQNPTLTTDGLTMAFSSTRGGGQGGQDVWIAHRATKTSSFEAPVALAEANSSANDYPSWLSADRCRLYMYSDRSGVLHTYVAQRPH
jgi:WD40-like Beta Propeller Repeat